MFAGPILSLDLAQRAGVRGEGSGHMVQGRQLSGPASVQLPPHSQLRGERSSIGRRWGGMEGEISCPGYAIRMCEGVDQDYRRLCFDALCQGLLEALCRRLGYSVRSDYLFLTKSGPLSFTDAIS